MIPPKYKFYVAKSSSTNKTLIDVKTESGLINTDGIDSFNGDSNWTRTEFIPLNEINSISYSFKSSSSENLFIAYYESQSASSFISGSVMSNGVDISGIITKGQFPKNANYFRCSFKSASYGNYIPTLNMSGLYIKNKIEVKPHYKELNKKYAKESGQEFFRISLDGKINLFGSGYDIINQSSIEDQFVFIIDKYDDTSKKWVEYYRGEFSKTDCKFDHDKKKCELKTTAVDGYTEVMNKYENTYDLIKLAPEISKINLHKRSLMQVYVRGANSITNFFGGTYWEDDVNESIDDNAALINNFYFSYIKSGNEFYIKNSNKAGVNGIYAGTNGYYSNWNGYTCYLEKNPDAQPPFTDVSYFIMIKRNSDNKVLYKSETAVNIDDETLFSEDRDYTNDKHLRYTSKLIDVENAKNSCTISNLFTYRIYRRLLCDVDTVEDSEGVKNTYNLPSDDFVTDNRNYKKCIGLKGGLFFCTSRAVDEPTKYGLNDYGQYFTNQFIPSSTGLGRPLPISKNSWANASLWYVYDIIYEMFEERLRKQYTLKDSYSIGAAIKAILKKIDPNITHEPTSEYSQFLYGSSNPLGMERFYVYITQKTNILKGDYDQPAQKAETSLEELMKMLRDCFRCYWYIEDNKFKIEHVYFFMNGGSYSGKSNYQLDFTKLTDQFNKRLSSYFQSEIEYDKSELNQRYEFAWMDDVTDLFGGVTIDVKSNYIQKDKTEEINIGQFSSDIDYMLFNPSNFSEDGFALLCPVKNGSTLELPIITVNGLVDENKDIYTAVAQNWYASWIYLQNFYLWDMPAYSIESNVLNYLYTRDIKKCMKHTIEFPTEEDLDELELIKTSFGNGKIDEISISLDTRIAKVNLLYRPE